MCEPAKPAPPVMTILCIEHPSSPCPGIQPTDAEIHDDKQHPHDCECCTTGEKCIDRTRRPQLCTEANRDSYHLEINATRTPREKLTGYSKTAPCRCVGFTIDQCPQFSSRKHANRVER